MRGGTPCKVCNFRDRNLFVLLDADFPIDSISYRTFEYVDVGIRNEPLVVAFDVRFRSSARWLVATERESFVSFERIAMYRSLRFALPSRGYSGLAILPAGAIGTALANSGLEDVRSTLFFSQAAADPRADEKALELIESVGGRARFRDCDPTTQLAFCRLVRDGRLQSVDADEDLVFFIPNCGPQSPEKSYKIVLPKAAYDQDVIEAIVGQSPFSRTIVGPDAVIEPLRAKSANDSVQSKPMSADFLAEKPRWKFERRVQAMKIIDTLKQEDCAATADKTAAAANGDRPPSIYLRAAEELNKVERALYQQEKLSYPFPKNTASASTVKKWYYRMRDNADLGYDGLIPKYATKRWQKSSITEDVLAIVSEELGIFMREPKKRLRRTRDDIKKRIKQKKDAEELSKDTTCPCLKTLYRHLYKKYGPRALKARKYGSQAAAAEYDLLSAAPIPAGLFGRVEMDGTTSTGVEIRRKSTGEGSVEKVCFILGIDVRSRLGCTHASRWEAADATQVGLAILRAMIPSSSTPRDLNGRLMCGAMRRLHVDGGSEFKRELPKIMSACNIEFVRTPKYCPWTKSFIERFNQTSKNDFASEYPVFVVDDLENGKPVSHLVLKERALAQIDAAMGETIRAYNDVPQEELLNETPRQVWTRLMDDEQNKAIPFPLERMAGILCLGEKISRPVTPEGVTIDGLRFCSDKLKEILLGGDATANNDNVYRFNDSIDYVALADLVRKQFILLKRIAPVRVRNMGWVEWLKRKRTSRQAGDDNDDPRDCEADTLDTRQNVIDPLTSTTPVDDGSPSNCASEPPSAAPMPDLPKPTSTKLNALSAQYEQENEHV